MAIGSVSTPALCFNLVNFAACDALWYGEVYDPSPTDWTWTDMGSGHFASAGLAKAAHVRNPHYVAGGTAFWPEPAGTVAPVDEPRCAVPPSTGAEVGRAREMPPTATAAAWTAGPHETGPASGQGGSGGVFGRPRRTFRRTGIPPRRLCREYLDRSRLPGGRRHRRGDRRGIRYLICLGSGLASLGGERRAETHEQCGHGKPEQEEFAIRHRCPP